MVFNRIGLKSRNILLMYISCIISGLIFFLPVRALYYESHLFTLSNVALIFAIEAIAFAVFEVPSGAIADLFGRKKTLIVSFFMTFVGFTFLYIGGSMIFFFLFALTNSFGRSLRSGTDSALIYDTLKAEKKERYFKKVIGNYHALWPIGASIGSIIGGHLAGISLSLTVLFSLVPVSISFVLSLFLQEPEYEKEGHRNIFKHMIESSRLVLRNRQILILVIAGFFLWGMGECLHLLNPVFFEFKGVPLMYFGYISAAVFGLSSLGHYFSHAVSERIGNKLTLILAATISPVITIIATLTGHLTAAIIFSLSSIFFGLRNPVVHHLLNSEVSSSKRATVISMYNFTGQIGIAILIPFVGWLADFYNINTAFKISAAIMFIVPALLFFIKDRK
ncbi:MFS transporter [Candidatus Woesearchaeota archaeon]|nr:MFS transporter [Candidatus Woesearchaeota archaeon]